MPMRILQCKRFISKCGDTVSHGRIVKDYEFDFYRSGRRTMTIDGCDYPITKGDFVFRKPGQRVQSRGDYDCYILTVDFSEKREIAPEHYFRENALEVQELCDNELLEQIPPVYHPLHEADFVRILENLCKVSYPHPADGEAQLSYTKQLLYLLAADALHAKETAKKQPTVTQEVCTFLQRHYPEKLSLSDIAAHAHISPSYLLRLFKREIGLTPIEYLIQTRLDHARFLLAETDHSVKAIAQLSGFCDPSFFTQTFRKRFGMPPAQYRN